jgi:hypothetical protein
MGGGLMRGELMLRGWKGMYPAEHYGYYDPDRHSPSMPSTLSRPFPISGKETLSYHFFRKPGG